MSRSLHRPLPGNSHLAFLPAACLAVRGGVASCDRCAVACPVDALKVGADGTALVGDCLRCGRCAAACPSGALVAKGFDEAGSPAGNLAVAIECWKVPQGSAEERALRVPCLGGIPRFLLLEWLIAALPRRLVFVDRGWCAGCSAGTGNFAGEAVLAALAPWLEACGLPAAQWPQQADQPLPKASMPEDIPPAASQIAMGRRAFFGRLGREIVRSERPAEPPGGPRAAVRRTDCPLPARERFLAALERLAAALGRVPPAAAYPRLEIGPACRDHGLCAGVCPTGALMREAEDGGIALYFASSACTACGRCVTTCPEQAIRLATGGSPQRQMLHRHEARACLECGRSFAHEEEESLCPSCRRQHRLARSLFSSGPDVAER